MNTTTVGRIMLVVLLVGIGFIANIVVTDRLKSAEGQAPPPAPSAEADATAPAAAAAQSPATLPDLSSVAQRAIASVPNISSTQIVRRPASPLADDPFFRFFFGDDMFRTRREQSLGSGEVRV